ncbi:MAG TPA: nitrate- and nitrite sensing domain-containing protein, partial [Acidimicrobiales bacterium]|nr:nitrate- and nitrite sensing domain-containing protein [Acidimicrobiales bacterium]
MTNTSREVRDVRSQTELATATIGPTGLITSLQDERNWAVVELVGQQESVTLGVTGYPDTRARTDRALEEFRATVAGKGGDIERAFEPALQKLEGLAAVRQQIDANQSPRDINNKPATDTAFAGYADLIKPFLDANTSLALAIDNPALRQGAELIDTTSRQIEVMAELVRVTVDTALAGQNADRVKIAELARISDTFNTNADQIRNTAREPYAGLVAKNFPEQVTTQLSDTADQVLAGTPVSLDSALASVNVPTDQSYNGFRQKVAGSLASEADDLESSAGGRVWLFRLLALIAVLVAGVATWAVSRSITRPLRALTQQATDMANNRLPDAVLDILDTPLGDDVTVPHVDPIAVQTRDEVSDVAEALNTVQDSALDLAVEQAVLRRNIADSFVNLGRRNQNLLGRQLDFITELEHNETDPDTLANLFRLDHLATRMRRNAESLLVLAGIDPPRKWAAPVRITDAIRAALGEVEDYQRVTVRQVEPTTVMGSAAADLAHLLAELIENALIFSP